MSKFRRQLMMANTGVAPVLPYDAEIEYIESTGTQFIDTGIKPNSTYTFETKVAATTANYNCVYWGVRNSGNHASNNEQCYLNSNTLEAGGSIYRKIRLYSTASTSSSNWNSGIEPVVGTMYELTNISVVSSMHQMTYPITLFAFNVIGSVNASLGKCRIGGWKAYSGGQLVADFIPVRVGQTGMMYDRVSEQLFGNAGTGDFILGNDKN